MKLGKKPHVEDTRDLMLADFLTAPEQRLTPPQEYTSANVVQDGEWGMLLNDRLGSCVEAGVGHTQLVLGRRGGHHPIFDDNAAQTAYEEWAGYVPGDPSTDQGTDMREAARRWQQKGIIDAQGQYHRSGVYVWLEPGNLAELEYASYVFEHVVVGYSFPRNAMEAFNAGQYVFDYDASSPDEGGHCVPGFGRVAGNLDSVSWGHRVQVTPAFIENKMDSGFAVVSSSILGAANGVSPEGLDKERLLHEARALGVEFAA